MRIIAPTAHKDGRRTLYSFEMPADFKAAETNLIRTRVAGAILGNHSHPFPEVFSLVKGCCWITTWTESEGVVEHKVLDAPAMFSFEPREEHRLRCSNQAILLGYTPALFDPSNLIPATHLPEA